MSAGTVSSDPNIEPGKLFVGGLSWDTTKDKLTAYFEKFGEVKDSVVMKDPNTNNPRGFGFVTYSDPSSVVKVMSPDAVHMLDGKQIDPKPATMKGASTSTGTSGGDKDTRKKVFVGGINLDTKPDTIKEYFEKKGMLVNKVDLKHDKATERMRGFGFVEFESEESAREAARVHYHEIDGKKVEVKPAEPRFTASSSYNSRVQSYPMNQGGQYNGYGQNPAQFQGGYGYGQNMYGNFPPQYYPQYNTRQYSANQSYPNNYAGANYRGFENTAYTGGQQTSGGGGGQMYGQVDQTSYPSTGRSGYSSTGGEGYNAQTGYGSYESYSQSYPQQEASQRAGVGSYARGSQPQQQSTYYSTR